ncbi:uncharacterized protein FIBRA_06051 [Fibroporia radiculosa]|uniref:Uncharacterized protein n=1 Tax=Fibroporia radiculosa TaxID=599839 RepID=J4GS41_9APHY|nr:uncharacterized protein FIBRA_06051 [Fibroporia radiculosa]CCM03900.1 predicted protein [Fibroporia radiculosa]
MPERAEPHGQSNRPSYAPTFPSDLHLAMPAPDAAATWSTRGGAEAGGEQVLDMDFTPVIGRILKISPKERTTYLFSATTTIRKCAWFAWPARQITTPSSVPLGRAVMRKGVSVPEWLWEASAPHRLSATSDVPLHGQLSQGQRLIEQILKRGPF